MQLLGAGHPGEREQCELASHLYLLSTYYVILGQGHRFQQVLEDHLSRTTSLPWFLVKGAGSLFAQSGDVANHSLSLVWPSLDLSISTHLQVTSGPEQERGPF